MRDKIFIAITFCLLALTACEKEAIDTPATDDDVNQWIEQTMRNEYLWYSDLPDKTSLDFSADPETFFYALLSPNDGKDLSEGHHYFSTLEKVTATKAISNANDSYGFDFATANLKAGNNAYKIALVIYVLKNSPAEEAGLKRGDWIVGVNGSWGTIQDYDQLRYGGNVTLQLAEDLSDLELTRQVELGASRAVENTPFLKDSVYTYGNKRVGYLMYNHFSQGPDKYDYSNTSYNEYMLQLFQKFKSQNVDEFILDLRYNGGGLFNCAELLASLLAPKESLGKTFCINEFNDKNTDRNQSIPFLNTSEVRAGNLDLKRLFVLTGSTTASSSELVINSLIPYLGAGNIRLIGKQTFGKTVGMTIHNESSRYGWVLSPVSFRSYNSEHKADYENGFYPDIKIDEFNYELADFGQLGDPLLYTAMNEIINQQSDLRSATGPTPLEMDLEIEYNPQPSHTDNLIQIAEE